MQLGDKIKELRTENGLSQGALAKQIGVSQKAIDYWERGINEPKASYMPIILIYRQTFYWEEWRVTTDGLLLESRIVRSA